VNRELVVALVISLAVHLGTIFFPLGRNKVELDVTRGVSSLDVIVVKALPQEKTGPRKAIEPKEAEIKPDLLQKNITEPKEAMIANANPSYQERPNLEDVEKPSPLADGSGSEKKDGPDPLAGRVPTENWDFLNKRGSLTGSQPRYSKNPAPPYPLAAKRMGYEGTTVLNVKVMPDGTAGEVNVFESSKYEVLDNAAVEAVKDWTFMPARRMRIPVTEWVRIPIRFQLEKP